jgi:hypothetical protein
LQASQYQFKSWHFLGGGPAGPELVGYLSLVTQTQILVADDFYLAAGFDQ